MKKSARKQLTSEEKEELRDNWLAAAKSAEERRFLRKWASQKALSDKDRALICAWIDKPDGFEKRNEGFWRAAKRSLLGEVVYETAMERHKKLAWDEWLVACLITQGFKQGEIAPMMGKSPRAVEYLVAEVKQEIVQDLGCNIEAVTITQIARWFLGL